MSFHCFKEPTGNFFGLIFVFETDKALEIFLDELANNT